MERINGLDFCRAFFMLLGITLHSSRIYDVEQDWRVVSKITSVPLTFLSDFIHLFRMESFYIISGFFFLMLLEKKREKFLTNRIERALMPMLFCGITLNSIMNYYSENFHFDNTLNYVLWGSWLGHLWFLGNLIIYFLIANYAVYKIIDLFSKLKLVTLGYCIIPIVSIPLFIIGKLLLNFNFIFVNVATLGYYFCYFIFGSICFVKKKEFFDFMNSKLPVIIGIPSIIIFIAFTYTDIYSENFGKVIKLFFSAPLTFLMISLVYRIGEHIKNMRLISESSYSIYLLHQPLIIVLYLYFFESLTSPFLSVIALTAMTFIICFSVHFLVIKKSRILKYCFNGVR